MEGRIKETNKEKKCKGDRTGKLIKPKNKRGECRYITNMDSVQCWLFYAAVHPWLPDGYCISVRRQRWK